MNKKRIELSQAHKNLGYIRDRLDKMSRTIEDFATKLENLSGQDLINVIGDIQIYRDDIEKFESLMESDDTL
jgi:hypothetical protein